MVPGESDTQPRTKLTTARLHRKERSSSSSKTTLASTSKQRLSSTLVRSSLLRPLVPAHTSSPESGATTTFRSLISSSRQFADGFSRTLPPSHPARTILIYAPNSLLYPVLLFGALAAGITLTTANNNYTASELVHQLKNSGAALVIVGEDGVAVAKAAAREVGIGEEMIYVIGGAKEGLNSVEELRGSEEFKAVEIREEERGTKVACEFGSSWWVRQRS